MANIIRFLDWIGNGNPISPENIGISLTYDTVNQDCDDDFDEFTEDCICEANHSTDEPEDDYFVSGANLIRTFKTLLDEGIITQGEFEAKKKQLLGV